MSPQIRGLIEALNAYRGLTRLAQDRLTEYLIPDGIDSAQCVDELLTIFDGPAQRAAEQAAQAAIANAETEVGRPIL